MKAHKFVADFGIEKAKEVLEVAPKDSLYLNQLTGFYYKIKCDDVMYGSDDESKGGWVVSTWPIEDLGRSKHTVSLEKLKQVVESVGIVNKFDNVQQAIDAIKNAPDGATDYRKLSCSTRYIKQSERFFEWWDGGDWRRPTVPFTDETHILRFTELSRLEKAIADYEAVESYKQVNCEVLDMVDASPRCEVINETH